jgi:hypothetical protein
VVPAGGFPSGAGEQDGDRRRVREVHAQVVGPSLFRAGSGGAPVAAPVGGLAVGPARFQPAPAPPARQQVPPHRRPAGPRGAAVSQAAMKSASLTNPRRMRGTLGDDPAFGQDARALSCHRGSRICEAASGGALSRSRHRTAGCRRSWRRRATPCSGRSHETGNAQAGVPPGADDVLDAGVDSVRGVDVGALAASLSSWRAGSSRAGSSASRRLPRTGTAARPGAAARGGRRPASSSASP